ncbi:MAG: P-loop containing nucleoside triphosphate hydrolase protein [Benniella sp.]|nr:MAG: P-loop containing nucleoside triphosphate hydrolase protein [Benniella sp.]
MQKVMPLLKSYLEGDLSPRDKAVLADIIAQGVKTDAGLVMDPNLVVAKTDGRVPKAVIDSLLERVIFPSMLDAAPRPLRASDLCLDLQHSPSHLPTGQQPLDQLLGGQGWASGEVNEICGSSGAGKTQLCLMTMVLMLVHNRTSQAIWIDTLDSGFSAQRASDVVRAHIQERQQEQTEENEQYEGDALVEDQVAGVLSRIQVYTCRDVYDVINVVEVIRTHFEQADNGSGIEPFARIVVIDSLTAVFTGLLRGTDGVGHATMMHTARELRRLALDFNVVVLVTTSTVQMSHPEEQTPSILITSNVKPSLGSSWRYATDMQLYLTKLHCVHLPGHESVSFADTAREGNIETLSNERTGRDPRAAEIMKSKRLTIGSWCVFDFSPQGLKLSLSARENKRIESDLFLPC